MTFHNLTPGQQIIGPSGTVYAVVEITANEWGTVAKLQTDYPTEQWLGLGMQRYLEVDAVALERFVQVAPVGVVK